MIEIKKKDIGSMDFSSNGTLPLVSNESTNN